MKHVWVFTHSISDNHLPQVFSSEAKAKRTFYKEVGRASLKDFSFSFVDEKETRYSRYRLYRDADMGEVMFGYERVEVG